MERRPVSRQPVYGNPENLRSPDAQHVPTTPGSQADALEPFLIGGGAGYYLHPFAGADGIAHPRVEVAAVQLLALLFVPPGRTAFIKQIMCAPGVNPIFADPWRGWQDHYNTRETGPAPRQDGSRTTAQAGLWETPLAWENYRSETPQGEVPIPPGPTQWTWQITAIPGSLALQRSQNQIPPFDITNPASWYCVPDIAVPAFVYPAGLPGRMINGSVGPQRIQAHPRSPLNVHYPIAENTTIALWATWRQGLCSPVLAIGPNGPDEIAPAAFPLLPSVGSLSGYMQPSSRESTAHNAAHGWGG